MTTKKFVSKTGLLVVAGASVIIPSVILMYKGKLAPSQKVISGMALAAVLNVALVALVTWPITKEFSVKS